LGAGTIALPLIIHLLGRGHARVHRFPTLRFIDPSRLKPTRRTRVSDVLLLVVRAAALVVAAAALAQPLLLTSRRSTAANAALARVVIIDTSAIATAGGRVALDSVNRATAFARDATVATVISTGDPSAALPGAIAWLETQNMRREIAILSRFRLGALDSVDIASVPASIGLRFARVPVRAPAPTRGPIMMPVILASAGERAGTEAARDAAMTMYAGSTLDVSTMAIVEPGYEGRTSLLARSIRPRRAWMMDVVAALARDSLLAEAARAELQIPRFGGNDQPDTNVVVVARTDSGRPVVLAAENTEAGSERLLLFSLADAGSLTSAALFSAVAHALSYTPSQWLEPSTIPDEQLSTWQRAPSPAARPSAGSADDGESDGRWLWIGVLALLALETWLRRERRRADASPEVVHDRAA
jgi:hypothetical protein